MAERRKLTTNPLTSTEGVALQVDDVYVPLGLVERKKPSKRQDKPDSKQGLDKHQHEITSEQGSQLYQETEITKTFKHDEFLDQVLKQKNTPKSQGKRIAIIGEPGAGKTTTLQQITQWIYDNIADAIVIWVSLADLRGEELKSYLFKTWLNIIAEKQNQAETSKALKENFVSQFNQGRVWLLLDGLDEMSAEKGNPLTEISRQIREGGSITQARIILTCRVNLWDGSINALDDFDTYRTLNFSYPEQIERFIAKWFIAIPQAGKRLCEALKAPEKERIQDLVKNPLRLTLLCLNWQSGDGKLPETQAGLYQRFVDDFNKWKQEEFATKSDKRQQLNVKLGELAKEAIDKESTRFRLRQGFVSRFLGDADDENSLLKLALKLGWLNQVGVDTERKPIYAFFHASFQEYFAAKAIDDWHFFLNHIPGNPSQGTYRIFEPQWKQTILLWLGRPEENLKQQQQQFIDALVNFKDGCGKWEGENVDKGFYEYRAYFLASAGLTEFKDYPQADEIVAQIVKWGFGYLNKQQEWVQFWEIQEDARLALQQTDRTKAIAALVELLQSPNVSDSIRKQAAESLGKIDPGNEIAIAALVQLVQSNHVDKDTRKHVAESLGKIDPSNEIAITPLVQLLQSDGINYSTRWQTASTLGQIDPGNKTAIAPLVQLLQSDGINDSTRWQTASTLGQIDPGNKTAIAALVQLLQLDGINDSTRWQVASTLGKIATGNEIAIAALVQLLQSTDVHEDIRRWLAYNLGQIDPGNEIAITALVQLLQSKDINNVDDLTFGQVVSTLGEIATGNEIAIAALVQMLQSKDGDEDIRRWLAYSLGQIDPGNKIAIAALVQLLQSTDVHEDIRWWLAYSLGQIDPGNEIAIAALVQLLQSTDVYEFRCRQVASILEKIGTGNENAIAALVELLQSKGKRWPAANILGKILPNNKHRFAIVKALSSYWQLDDKYYKLAWKCSQNMPYLDFYQAWHQHNVAIRGMRTLKKILFTIF